MASQFKLLSKKVHESIHKIKRNEKGKKTSRRSNHSTKKFSFSNRANNAQNDLFMYSKKIFPVFLTHPINNFLH